MVTDPLWPRLDASFTDEEKHRLIPLLLEWRNVNSTTIGLIDMDVVPAGPWVDLEPDWSEVDGWLR
jgi:hypothetical protein